MSPIDRRSGARAAAVSPSETDRSTFAIRVACSGPVHPDTLEQLDRLVGIHPDAVDLQFARGCLLEALGRAAAARHAYAGVLRLQDGHVGARTNLATLAYVDGHRTEALALYRRVAGDTPADAAAHVNVANVLADNGAFADSRASYERALALAPDHPVAHAALADVLARCGDAAGANAHRERAYARPVLHVTPARDPHPLRVLVPFSADGGNLVATLFFEPGATEVTTIVAQSHADDRPLPPHDVIVNAVADADRSAAALQDVARIVAASGRPCINAPASLRATGRATVAARLHGLRDVVVPRTIASTRAGVTAAAAAAGIEFPLLLRAAGFHAGRHVAYVATPAQADAALASLPGDAFFAIEFVATRNGDGRYYKYRMLIVDGALIPLHLAIARAWNVHYFNADNPFRAESRALEAAFLSDPRAHLGDAAFAALERIAATLALDYGGIDFALDATGAVVVFEANATFAMFFPDDDATAEYRRPAVQRAVDAVRTMIRQRASGSRERMRKDSTVDQRKHAREP